MTPDQDIQKFLNLAHWNTDRDGVRRALVWQKGKFYELVVDTERFEWLVFTSVNNLAAQGYGTSAPDAAVRAVAAVAKWLTERDGILSKEAEYQAVCDALRVPFVHRNLTVTLTELEDEHYGSHCKATVSFQGSELFSFDTISHDFRTLKAVVVQDVDSRIEQASRLLSIVNPTSPYR